MYQLTEIAVCKLIEKKNLRKEDVNQFLDDSIDASDVFIGHTPGLEPKDSKLQQAGSSPKRTHSRFRRDRVESAVQFEVDYEAWGPLHRDSVRRQYKRGHSPTKYYSETVSFYVLNDRII